MTTDRIDDIDEKRSGLHVGFREQTQAPIQVAGIAEVAMHIITAKARQDGSGTDRSIDVENEVRRIDRLPRERQIANRVWRRARIIA